MGLVDWLNRRVAPRITALGITPRSVTLEVRGRRSGRPVRLSMSPARYEGRRYLVSLAGERSWVKNVRAAKGDACILHAGRTPVHLRELPPEERAPILLAYVGERAFTRSRGRAARLYFGTESPSLEHMQTLVEKFPVFAIEPRAEAT